MKRPYRLGLDLGSTAAKAALLDGEGVLLGVRLNAEGKPPAEAARGLADALLAEYGLSAEPDAVRILATGYGRAFAGAAIRSVTEITCHARGVRFLHPDASGILDIGGQDAKAIRLEADGSVGDFAMNDKCAAGTGRFLEVAASRHHIGVEDLAEFCGGEAGPGEGAEAFEISSTCVVFAESELVGLNVRGVPPREALRAVHRAIARRTVLLLRQAKVGEPLYFTGGVARNGALRKAIEAACGMEVRRAEHCQFTGAIGAALLA